MTAERQTDEQHSRRRILAALAALPAAAFLVGPLRPRPARAELEPTPACDGGPTPEQTEGPYFTPQSPQRNDFSGDGAPGEPIVLTGTVLSTTCQPVPDTLIDVWHADGTGVYDNEGYKLRGHFFTDAGGAYRLTTVTPGLYPGRTRHFHVKVRPPNGAPLLTTQLYFPDEPANRADGLYQPELEMDVPGPGEASFTFVVETSPQG